jgi:hypothetical protein
MFFRRQLNNACRPILDASALWPERIPGNMVVLLEEYARKRTRFSTNPSIRENGHCRRYGNVGKLR